MQDFLALATNYRSWTRNFEYAAELSALYSGSLTGIFVSEPIVPLQSLNTPMAAMCVAVVLSRTAGAARAGVPAEKVRRRARALQA